MSVRPLRLVFMGSPDLAVPILEALLKAGHEVVSVYTQPPRPAGRGMKETLSPVHAFASGRGLEVRIPENLKSAETGNAFAALNADAAVVAAYGLILPLPVLAAPRLGCLNVHASLLPRWRGASPIQHAIMAGDAETGITIMKMDEGLDTGDILLAETVPITSETTAQGLHDALARLGARLIVETLEKLAQGRLQSKPQGTQDVSYAPRLTRADGRIDWKRPAVALERQVRALNPWPGVWCQYRDGEKTEKIGILAAEVMDAPPATASGAPPGVVMDDRLGVACGSGALSILRLQRAGKAAMEAADFLRGHPLPAGSVLT